MSLIAGVCVDNTEVSERQYLEFLDAKNGDTSGQPAMCSWNTYYEGPLPSWADLDDPRSYVDWCDARAFCEWSGKRMCGSSGQWMQPEAGDHELGQVCIAQFGAEQVSAQCDKSDFHHVGTLATCTGAPPNDQVFDILGNVSEWAGCRDADKCYSYGTNIHSNPTYYKCTAYSARALWDIEEKSGALGFRCCADPL